MRVYCITGASSGIGKATSLRLAGKDSFLILNGRNEKALHKTMQECAMKGSPVLAITGDLFEEETLANLKKAFEQQGKLDGLVQAAGTIVFGSIEETSAKVLEEQLQLHVLVPYKVLQIALPYLKKARGAVVHVSSTTGIRAFPNLSAYCTAKAGLDHLTRCAALELAPFGVRVNTVNPGVVKTELHKRGGLDEKAYKAFLEHSKTTHPLGRVGKPEEVAALIAFLLSEEAGWITGVSVPIDGGRTQTCAR